MTIIGSAKTCDVFYYEMAYYYKDENKRRLMEIISDKPYDYIRKKMEALKEQGYHEMCLYKVSDERHKFKSEKKIYKWIS